MLSRSLRALGPTPLLNRPDFEDVFKELPRDDQGLMRALEMVALKDTLFTVVENYSTHILQVKTNDYPSNGPLYLDARFTTAVESASDREKKRPHTDLILSRLKSSLGLPYIWGGNWGAGIFEIAKLYPHSISPNDESTYLLKGLDCSGLLYEATDGYTPRNTSELLTFGKPVLNIKQIQPLDIIVWPGHVIICLSKDTIIESLLGSGVILSNLKKRINQIQSKSYEIRRF